ncbi:MAG: EamA family transporter, partial [Acidobacteriota bacterium]
MILRDKAALAAVLMMAILFGASFTGTKIALATFTPFELIFLRFAISSLCFLLIRPWRRHGRLPASDYGKLFLLAFFEPGIYFFCEAEGVKRTLASTASILIATIPLFVLVLEALYLKVRMIWSEVLMISRDRIPLTRRWVVKIGSALLTRNGQGLDRSVLAPWVEQMTELRRGGSDLVLVSSGAVAEGMCRMGWTRRP